MNIILDIETRPQPKAMDSIMALQPKFDPDSVAVGNLKDEEKIKKKIIDAGIAHEKKMVEWREKSKKTCCLDADLGQLSAIGILFVETGTHHIIDCEKEVDALVEFWSICDSTIRKGYKVFGWNTDGFDLPFLFGRSRLLGVRYDPSYISNYRYFNQGFVDLHKVWTFGQYGKFCKLEKAYRALGEQDLELDVTGGSFHEYWERGGEDREKAKAYLKHDLNMTFAIARATHGIEVKEPVTGGAFDDTH